MSDNEEVNHNDWMLDYNRVKEDAPFPQRLRHAWHQYRWLKSVTKTPSSVLPLQFGVS